MAIGEDNPPPGELPDLPAIGGLGGNGGIAASAAQSSRGPRADAGPPPGPASIHRDSDAPSDGVQTQPGSGSIHDPYLGKTFGGYELVEKIGQGGMGVVYKGRQVSLDRTVAVKILNKQLYDNQEFIKRFEREAKSIARINHPNIVSVYDFGQSDGLWYMVTEFVEGSSLSRLISEKLMLDPKELSPLMIQCLAGLAYVGGSGIVHRDIKPDNILITKEGIAKIADFGLAKDVSGNDHTDLTAVGLAMGTPAYMSPEQCMGRRLDGRSDIYALGVTAYFALAGEKPFVGHSSFEIMTKQREYNPPPPSQLNPRITKECSDLVLRMLAKNPKDRFDTAEQCRVMWVDLNGHLLSQRASMRTGEWEMPQPAPSPMTSKSNRNSVPLPAPPSSVPPLPPAASPMGPGGPGLAAGDLPQLPPPGVGALPPPLETGRTRRPATEPPAGQDQSSPGTEGHMRPITERRLRQMADAVTCPRCGMLNRAELATCSKCGNALRDTDPDVAARAQEAEAQRLLESRKYGEAAAIYARLADKEVDRRQRSILRSKEREVRKLDLEQQVSEVMGRAKSMVERGDVKGAIASLEQATAKLSSDATSSTSGMEISLSRELATLRSRVSSRKRMRMIVVLVVVIALAVGGFLAKDRIMSAMGMKPAAAATSSSLEHPRPASAPRDGI